MDAYQRDRRRSARYPLKLHFRYRVLEGLQVTARGTGTTMDFSRSAVRFHTTRVLPAESRIEMIVNWPVLFSGFHPIELRVVGTVVERRGANTVMRIANWRFRFPPAARSEQVLAVHAH
jgi:hypothetical protein